METAPKAAFPVRPRFRPIDYITGKVPAIDSEEYQQILKEEEEIRLKAAEEAKERQQKIENANSEAIDEVVSKLNLQITNERPKRKRSKSFKPKYIEEEPPSRTYRKKSSVKTEDDVASLIFSESSISEANGEHDLSDDESTEHSNIDEIPSDGRILYQVDDRLLDYILNKHEEASERRNNEEKEKEAEENAESPNETLQKIPERDQSFGLETLKNGDTVWIDKRERNDGFKKAMILLAYHEYNFQHKYFEGQQIVLNEKALERIKSDGDKDTSVFLVHYLNSDRRLDEWIDAHEVHCLIERAIESSPTEEEVPKKLDNSKTRSDRKLGNEFSTPGASKDVGATYARCEEKLEKVTMVRNIDTIEIGPHAMGCWYFSPFPPKVVVTRNLYMCEHCLWYCAYSDFYALHKKTCKKREPPGPVIYNGDKFVVHEVNGNENYRYCQSLCLLSKLFLDHKTIFYAIKTFYFYVLTEVDENGNKHIAGFFSKENFSMNNLACIMVLPPYQRKGYGKFLIQLSYTLSCRENFIGSPEKPLSDLGKVSYRSIWWFVLINTLEALGVEEDYPVSELSLNTGIHEDDIISTFESQQLIKKWKDGIYVVFNEQILVYCKSLSMFRAPKLFLDVDRIIWTKRYQVAMSEHEYNEETRNENLLKRKMSMEKTRKIEVKKAKQELSILSEEKGFGGGYIGCLDSSDDEDCIDDYLDYSSIVQNMPLIDEL